MSETTHAATYPHRGVTVTEGWATGQPYPIPDRQPVARIPEQPNPVQIIRTQDAPDPAELERARLARRRPADRSARAVQNALDAVVLDRAEAGARLAGRQDAVERAMASGTPAAVLAARNALELASIEVQQLEAMEAVLRVSLARAQAEEAEELNALAASVPAAQAKVAAFHKFIDKDYPALAAKIAAGLALEVDAEAAHAVLRTAAANLGHDAPEPLPRAAEGTLQVAYRYRASLPGTDVRPLAKWAPAPAIQY